MVLRWVSTRHTANIATGAALQALAPPGAGDIRGNVRYLAGIRTQGGADAQRYQVTSPDWGARILEVPPQGQGGLVAGLRTTWLPYLQKVNVNQIVNAFATQNVGIAQVTTVDLLYLEGTIPQILESSVGKLHCQFMTGTANAGVMPGAGAPTAAQRLNQEVNSVWAPIRMAGVTATTGNMQITYPEADGQGPQAPCNLDVLQDHPWTDIPPMTFANAGDTVDLGVEDIAAAVTNAWIMWVQVEGGTTLPANRFSPMFGTTP